jgi:protein arginine kinase activator
MKCDRCGQRPATIHHTVIVNGQKQESHLCEVCFQQTGAAAEFSFPNLSIQNLLASFLGQEMPGKLVAPAEPQCKSCGMTYSQFAETGRLGCAQCYDELEPHLIPLIKRIHGTVTHGGKAPRRTGGLARKKRDLATLRHQLQMAVQNEQYEEAARLRDAIRQLEQELQAGGDGGGVE